MSFFAVLIALVIEQFKPLPRDNWVHHTLVSWVGWTGRNFDAGREQHAWVVWCVSVLAPGVLLIAVCRPVCSAVNACMRWSIFSISLRSGLTMSDCCWRFWASSFLLGCFFASNVPPDQSLRA